MATIQHTSDLAGNGIHVVTWILSEDDDGTPVEMGAYADKTVQLSGTFGGTSVALQGSNDGLVWFTLADYDGAALVTTANGLGGIRENTRYIRPLSTGGVGATVKVCVFSKRVR